MAVTRPDNADSDTGDYAGVGPARESTTGTPRWVKAFGIIAVVLVLLFIILLLTRGPGGRGGHTPFRHFGGQAPAEGRHG